MLIFTVSEGNKSFARIIASSSRLPISGSFIPFNCAIRRFPTSCISAALSFIYSSSIIPKTAATSEIASLTAVSAFSELLLILLVTLSSNVKSITISICAENISLDAASSSSSPRTHSLASRNLSSCSFFLSAGTLYCTGFKSNSPYL